MKQYPIRVIGNSYKGAKPALQKKAQNTWRIAKKIEDYINGEMKNAPENSIKQFLNYRIASDIGEDPKIVRSLVMRIDGGHNGATIYKGDYEKALNSNA